MASYATAGSQCPVATTTVPQVPHNTKASLPIATRPQLARNFRKSQDLHIYWSQHGLSILGLFDV